MGVPSRVRTVATMAHELWRAVGTPGQLQATARELRGRLWVAKGKGVYGSASNSPSDPELVIFPHCICSFLCKMGIFD